MLLRACPERSRRALEQRHDQRLAERRARGPRERVAVIPNEPAARRDPQALFPILAEREDRVTREAVLHGEGLHVSVMQA